MQHYMYLWDCFEMGAIDYNTRNNSTSYNDGLIKMAGLVSECIISLRGFCFNLYKLENDVRNKNLDSDPYVIAQLL